MKGYNVPEKRLGVPVFAAASLGIVISIASGIRAYADLQPFYNFSVTVSTEDDFNEKIEVYVAKNGEFYGDYDLNQSNQYLYKTELEAGTYEVYARVRYDQDHVYQVSPESLKISIGDIDYKDMHEAVFQISGMEESGEGHEFQEYVPSDGETVYSAGQMDELRNIQESARKEGERAFLGVEEWERENSFLAQNGIDASEIPNGNRAPHIPQHSYPQDETQNEQMIPDIPEQETEISQEETVDGQEQDENGSKTGISLKIGILITLGLAFLCGALAIVIARTKKGQYDK